MASQYQYKTIVRQAKPRTGETLEGAAAFAREYSGGGSIGGGSLSGGSPGSGSNLSIVAGDRIVVEETPGASRTTVKISHAVPKDEDIDSQTTADRPSSSRKHNPLSIQNETTPKRHD